MLGSLHGTAAHLDNRTLIEVQGVGYWVFTGSWQPQGEITAYLYHHVREDMSDLYGFPSLPDLTLFEKLISVSGIGPKAALSILSLGSAQQIATAISQQDTAFLSSASGVGSKAAQKIVLELAGKLGGLAFAEASQLSIPQYQELRLALESLGYKASEAGAILQQVPPELTTTDAQLKWALQQLAR